MNVTVKNINKDGFMNDNGPHRLIWMLCLQLVELVCEGLEGVALLKKMSRWGWFWDFKSPYHFQFSFCPLLINQDIIPQLLLKQYVSLPHAVFLASVTMDSKLKGCLCIAVLSQQERNMGNKHESRYKNELDHLKTPIEATSSISKLI